MSKVGKNPISVPSGVKVEFENNLLTVQGPKGTLARKISDEVSFSHDNGRILFTRPDDSKRRKSLHGTTRAVVANMVKGVTEGFARSLSLVGVGYRAELQGSRLTLQLGYSHPVVFIPPLGVKLDAPGGVRIEVSGIDKELVAMVADKIRSFRPPEPYKGKGIRYTDEHVRKKAGKTAA
jgi:large subunit ribosomal protein L6